MNSIILKIHLNFKIYQLYFYTEVTTNYVMTLLIEF